MLKKHEQLRVHDLLDKGYSPMEVARRTGRSPATIYKYKRLGRQLQGSRETDKDEVVPGALIPFQGLIDHHIKQGKLKRTTILLTLQQAGYRGSRTLFDGYYHRRRQALQSAKYLQHVETEKGEQAQVDWGHFGEIMVNGKREKVYLFAYILSWSRAIYLEFVVRQNQRTLQLCHIHAFEKLGIPKTIVYDNMKTVVSRREKLPDGITKIHYNPAFLDFAQYYQFEPIACPPYWPRAKGKVEASIKYVRNYFSRVTPRVVVTLDELNIRLTEWVDQEAQQRIHGTTQERPDERWQQEKSYLSFPTNLPLYNLSPFQTYHTNQYGLLIRDSNTYNLGPKFARIKLEVREIQKHGLPVLEVYRHNEHIITVPVPAKRHSWVSVHPELYRLAKTQKQIQTARPAKKRKPRPYDIPVERRGLDHYSINIR